MRKEQISPLQRIRQQYQPIIPERLKGLDELEAVEEINSVADPVSEIFPKTGSGGVVRFVKGVKEQRPYRVAVVLSGGQAPGGHDVIAGLFDALQELHPESELIGFLGGPSGLVSGEEKKITESVLLDFRNTGGFHLIGSGRTKIETQEQFQAVEKMCQEKKIDAIVIIGGDDSNTNAALLAEYLEGKVAVVGVPKTIDGDLKGKGVETSFGFDTATKTFSSLIGNVACDALSAAKYYFFIKLMGRSASHITLESALQTQPNLTLISEEVADKGWSLKDVCGQIADLVEQRAEKGKHYGMILIPEGIIEFIPECMLMIQELNQLLSEESSFKKVQQRLSPDSLSCFTSLPESIQKQLLLDRDPHGNVQVSKIDTERLLLEMTKVELKKRGYQGPFSAQPMFFGYEGRSAYPSNFDVNYSYNLGRVAAVLLSAGKTGCMAALKGLNEPVKDWEPVGIRIAQMVVMEKRHGKDKPVIEKALVDLQGEPFRIFASLRDTWRLQDMYSSPGPIQFFGDQELTDATTKTLQLEKQAEQALA